MKRLLPFVLMLAALAPAHAQDRAAADRDALAQEAVALAATVPDAAERQAAQRGVAAILRRLRTPEEMRLIFAWVDANDPAGVAHRERCRMLSGFGLSAAALEAEVAGCGMARQHPVNLPRGAAILDLADAVPAGGVRMRLLFHAFQLNRVTRPEVAAAALSRLRALLPQLPAADRTHAGRFLDFSDVHRFEGRHRPALDLALRRSDPYGLPIMVVDLVRDGEIDLAMDAAAALQSRGGCPFTGAAYMTTGGWTDVQRARLGTFVDRLRRDEAFRRSCPDGFGATADAEVELAIGRIDRAIAALDGLPANRALYVGRLITDRLVQLGETDRARALVRRLARRLPPLTPAATRVQASSMRFLMVAALAAQDDRRTAERLARTFPGPGWRAAALAVAASGNHRPDMPQLPPLH